MSSHGIIPTDLLVSNLYPFESVSRSGKPFDVCVENIDIGGPTMIRAAAKNHAFVTVITSPTQFPDLIADMEANGGCTSLALRKRFAAEAFRVTAHYDSMIARWMCEQVPDASDAPDRVSIPLNKEISLKYGCNPHQLPASVYSITGAPLPFEILHGTPGYINLLDALNAWCLVKELKEATGLPAAASFKHVSPTGAAVAVPLTAQERVTYDVDDSALSAAALAYVRARQSDPMCSFGDFAAVSDEVDESFASVIKAEVSDGIIAPSYTPAALEILRAKKGGKFIILAAAAGAKMADDEWRVVHGCVLTQKRNSTVFTRAHLDTVVTASKEMPDAAARDLIVASTAIKYTQSNSVAFAVNGQAIGIGAGQQSRVDCVKLAARKLATWFMRQHPSITGIRFKSGVKRQDKVNARVRIIEGNLTPEEREEISAKIEGDIPAPLSEDARAEFMKTLPPISLSSDAFFPYPDSIHVASQFGVKYLVHPGGSIGDAAVTAAANAYGMVMATSGLRLFHH